MALEYELSKQDIEEIANQRITIITAQNKTIILNSIFNTPINKHNTPYLVHYQTDNHGRTIVGHWACMIINKYNKTVYWFDSYGIFPDDELDFIPYSYRRITNQKNRYIGNFLYTLMNRGYKISYNDKQLQRLGDGIATCGRYCALFIALQPITPEDFVAYLNEFKPSKYPNGYDDIVTIITSKIIDN
jgi:hypothetical protein